MTAVFDAWFDDVKAIYECLSRDGLDGLRQLIKVRMRLPQERRRELQDLIIRKRFVLKPDGLWRILDAEIHEGNRVGAAIHFERGSDADLEMRQRQRYVMTAEEAGDVQYSMTHADALPDQPCDWCHGTWSIDNFYEARSVRDRSGEQVWRCARCEQLRQIQDGLQELRSIVDATPLCGVRMRLIPNQYWPTAPRDYPVDPWAILETDFGEIRIGWRKRVVHIDWDRAPALASIQGSEIVEKPEVTSGATMVHCWSTEKASEALRRLCELGAARRNDG